MLEPVNRPEGDATATEPFFQQQQPDPETAQSEGADDFGSFTDQPIPPEGEEIAAKLQADYTRKMQALAEQRKELEKEKEKAAAFDRLMTDPQYRQALFGAAGALQGPGEPSESAAPPFADVNLDEVLDPDTKTAVQAAAYQVIQEHLLPDLERYKNVIEDMYREAKVSEWNSLVQKYPVAKNHLNEVSAFLQANPNVSLEQALFAVAGRELVGGAHTTPTTQQGRIPGMGQPANGTGSNGATMQQAQALMTPGAASGAHTAPKKRPLVDIVKEAMRRNGMLE